MIFKAASRGPDIWRHRKPGPLLPGDLTKEERIAWEAKVHHKISERLHAVQSRLEGNLRNCDTDAFWRHWCHSAEEGFVDAHTLDEAARRPLRGHEQVRCYTTSL